MWNAYDQLSLFCKKPEPNLFWVAIDFWITFVAIFYVLCARVVLLRWVGWKGYK